MTADDNDNRLQSLQAGGSRRLRSGGSGYSFFVRLTKLVLPILALVIVAVVGVRLNAVPQGSLIPDLPGEVKTTAGQIEIAGARYEGADSQNRPYIIEADAASRDPADDKNVLMTGTRAQLAADEDSKLEVSAAEGSYHTETGKLALTRDIKLSHGGEYHLYLEQLMIDTKSRAASSDKPLTGDGPIGTMKASGVDVTNEGNLITFTGPATLTLIKKGQEG